MKTPVGSVRTVTGLTGFFEAAWAFERDGTYYLAYAGNNAGPTSSCTPANYHACIAYGTAPSPEGPWTYRGVILEKDASQGILGTGHSSIVQEPGTDEWFIAYHRFAIPGGDGTHRETTIDRLTFDANGFMQKVTPTLTSVATAPAVTASAPSGWVSSGTLTLTAPSGSIVQYRLPGGTWTTYAGPVTLDTTEGATTTFRIPADAKPGDTIHVIAEATDDGKLALTRYARAVVTVR